MPGAAQQARRRVAQNLREARQRAALTQEEAAERAGCSVQQLRRVERALTNVSIDLLSRLATACRVDLAALFVPAGPWKRARPGRPAQSIAAEPEVAYRERAARPKRP
jgi:transcriptional regulator with XRE-family HTH domain